MRRGSTNKGLSERLRRRGPAAPLAFLGVTVLAQLVGLGAGLASGRALDFPVLPLVVHSVVAWSAARWLSLPGTWQLLNLALPSAVVLFARASVPGWIPLVGLVLSVMLFLPAFWTRVPYYPSNLAAHRAVTALLPEDRDFTFVDIGCGLGGVLAHAARERPRGRFVGIEIGPLPYLVCKVRFLATKNVTIRFESLWRLSLEPFDVVYAFLAPPPMESLWEKAVREMRPGSIFVTNTFVVPASADRVVKLGENRQNALYVHEMKG